MSKDLVISKISLLIFIFLLQLTTSNAGEVTCLQSHSRQDGVWVEDKQRTLNYIETENLVLVGTGSNQQTYNFYSEDDEAKYFLNPKNQTVYRIQKHDPVRSEINWGLFTSTFVDATKNIWLRAYSCSARQ